MRSKMLEDPDRLRFMYQTLAESGDPTTVVARQMRSVLENIKIEDATLEGVLASLSNFGSVLVEQREEPDDAAKAALAIAVEHELYRARIALLKLK